MPTMPRRTTVFGAAVVVAVCIQGVDAKCSTEELDISWAAGSNRIYVNSGCAQISDIMEERLDGNGKQKGPIWHFNMNSNTFSDVYTGTYYMEANIHIRNGATLQIDGAQSQGDSCQTLLLASNPTITGKNSLNIRAHGGNLLVKDTKIFSWDLNTGDFDFNPDDGRAYLSALTEIITGRDVDKCLDDPKRGESGYSTGEAKNDMGVARMDIVNSEVAYLGYDESESYGVAYKARGLCKTLINLDIFDDDQPFNYGVYGDITNSELHHNWFGHYSFGHQGGKWNYNKVHDNFGYGFDPHDDSDHLEIIGNEVYNNGDHGIIASKRCTDITIADNIVYNNLENGIMLHRQCDRAKVYGNYVYENGDAGLALYESSDCEVYKNKFYWNRRGIRWSNGANRNDVYRNKIRMRRGADYAIYMYAGNDEPQAVGNTDGHVKDNTVYRNRIWSKTDDVWRMREADDNSFFRNIFNSGSNARVDESTGNRLSNTVLPEGFTFDVDSVSCFTTNTDIEELPKC